MDRVLRNEKVKPGHEEREESSSFSSFVLVLDHVTRAQQWRRNSPTRKNIASLLDENDSSHIHRHLATPQAHHLSTIHYQLLPLTATLPATMSKLSLPLAVLAAVASLTLSGCAWPWGKNKKPASSTHLYEGNSPSIHFNDKPEAAGGQFNPS